MTHQGPTKVSKDIKIQSFVQLFIAQVLQIARQTIVLFFDSHNTQPSKERPKISETSLYSQKLHSITHYYSHLEAGSQ